VLVLTIEAVSGELHQLLNEVAGSKERNPVPVGLHSRRAALGVMDGNRDKDGPVPVPPLGKIGRGGSAASVT
jgi:hypothetical protein